MSVQQREALFTLIGRTIYGAVLRQRTDLILQLLQENKLNLLASRSEPEVSMEIVVFGDAEEAKEDVHVVPLDPWVWDFRVSVTPPSRGGNTQAWPYVGE